MEPTKKAAFVFVCAHCGRIAADVTGAEVLDDGCTLECEHCGQFTRVSLASVPAWWETITLERGYGALDNSEDFAYNE